MDAALRSIGGTSITTLRSIATEVTVRGSIIDSWVEPPGPHRPRARLVLQVAPRERPRDLVFVEADAALVPDRGWLEDLGENTCHGSPVAALARPTSRPGFYRASRLLLAR